MQTRALVYDRYGSLDVLRWDTVEIGEPSADFVLVRVRAAALNPKDVVVRSGKFRALTGRRFPKFVGCDFAGEVVRVGPRAPGVSVGERVYGALNEWRMVRGTLADFVLVRVSECAPMPRSLGFEEAAAVPLCAQTALQTLRDIARVGSGGRVLIHGASGGVGVLAIQVARALGASVTTTSSHRNLDLCASLGADETLDYARDDAFAASGRYRAVFDVFGNLRFADVRGALDARGVYVNTVPSARTWLDVVRTAIGFPRARVIVVRSRRRDLDLLSRWIDDGRLRPVIDRAVDSGDALDALRYLATKRARGKVVVRMGA